MNDDRRMQKMKTTDGAGGIKGIDACTIECGKLTIREGVNQLTVAALAPKAFIDRLVDPEDGDKNLGFYSQVTLMGDDNFDSKEEGGMERMCCEGDIPQELSSQHLGEFMLEYDSECDFNDGYQGVESDDYE